MGIRNLSLGGVDWQDTGNTTLNGAINDSVTTISLTDASGFKSGGGIVLIDSEKISYTGVSTNDLTGCTRGAYGSTATSHIDTTTVQEIEILFTSDLNDTFDALTSKITTLSTFWLNSDLYDVYDDFESYSLGAFTTNTNWTVTTTGGSTATIVSSTEAGGTGKELKLLSVPDSGSTNTKTSEAVTLLLSDDKHVQIKIKVNVTMNSGSDNPSTANLSVKLGSQSYTEVFSFSAINSSKSSSCWTDILIVSKGSNVYDVFAGGKKLFSDVTEADPQLGIRVSSTGNNSLAAPETSVYIDDVRESKNTIS